MERVVEVRDPYARTIICESLFDADVEAATPLWPDRFNRGGCRSALYHLEERALLLVQRRGLDARADVHDDLGVARPSRWLTDIRCDGKSRCDRFTERVVVFETDACRDEVPVHQGAAPFDEDAAVVACR